MRMSRGMGCMNPKKIPGGKMIHRKDKPQDVEVFKKGGMAGGKWIQEAIKKPGALKKSLGVKQGETIPAKSLAKAAKSSGVTGKRARLAQTLKKLGK